MVLLLAVLPAPQIYFAIPLLRYFIAQRECPIIFSCSVHPSESRQLSVAFRAHKKRQINSSKVPLIVPFFLLDIFLRMSAG